MRSTREVTGVGKHLFVITLTFFYHTDINHQDLMEKETKTNHILQIRQACVLH